MDSDVSALAFQERKILDPVVLPVSVPMMDDLSLGQSTSEMLSHYQSMLVLIDSRRDSNQHIASGIYRPTVAPVRVTRTARVVSVNKALSAPRRSSTAAFT